MKNMGTKILALIFFIIVLHLLENNEMEQGVMWLIVKIVIITAVYILFKLIQTTQIYNNIRKVWRNHIACLIKCRERRMILMPFKNACLQFLYALFWFIVIFFSFMILSTSFGFEQSKFASYCFMLVTVYLVGMFWHISAIVGNVSKDESKAKNSKKLEIKNVNSIKTNQQKTVNENDWIKKIIWHDEKEIENCAKDYNKTPWYNTPRFFAPLIYFILATISLIFVMKEQDVYTYITLVWFAFSSIYFSVKGYRLAILLLIVLVSLDFIYTIMVYMDHINGGMVFAKFLIYGGIIGEMVTAFRVECKLAKNKLSPKKKILKDIFIGLVLPIVCVVLVATIITVSEGNKPLNGDDEKSARIIGTIYVHTTGVSNYCKDTGYILTVYPETFKKKFADKIVFAEQEMKRLNINSSSIYEIEGMNDTSYGVWRDERQVLIAKLVMNEKKVQLDEFKWDDQYYQILTQAEFCHLLDEVAEDFINNNQDLDILRD